MTEPFSYDDTQFIVDAINRETAEQAHHILTGLIDRGWTPPPQRTEFEQAIHEALGPGAGARAIDEWWASRPNYDGPRGVIAAVEATTEGGYLTPEKLKAARERLLDGEGRPRPQFAPGGPTLRSQPIRIEDDELLIIGSCGCGCAATSHTREGCQVVYGFAGPQCPCTTDVARLASKITGIGTEDTTP